jgi:hypothetical protein
LRDTIDNLTQDDFISLEKYLSESYKKNITIISLSIHGFAKIEYVEKNPEFGYIMKTKEHKFDLGEIKSIIREGKIDKILDKDV